MSHRWRKASKPKPCEVCGSVTWALSCHMGQMGVPRCMIHGLTRGPAVRYAYDQSSSIIMTWTAPVAPMYGVTLSWKP